MLTPQVRGRLKGRIFRGWIIGEETTGRELELLGVELGPRISGENVFGGKWINCLVPSEALSVMNTMWGLKWFWCLELAESPQPYAQRKYLR